MRVGQIHFAYFFHRASPSHIQLLHEACEKLHAFLALVGGHLGVDSGHHGEVEPPLKRTVEYHAVHVDQHHVAGVTQKSNRGALDNFNLNGMRQRPSNGGLLDPGIASSWRRRSARGMRKTLRPRSARKISSRFARETL